MINLVSFQEQQAIREWRISSNGCCNGESHPMVVAASCLTALLILSNNELGQKYCCVHTDVSCFNLYFVDYYVSFFIIHIFCWLIVGCWVYKGIMNNDKSTFGIMAKLHIQVNFTYHILTLIQYPLLAPIAKDWMWQEVISTLSTALTWCDAHNWCGGNPSQGIDGRSAVTVALASASAVNSSGWWGW